MCKKKLMKIKKKKYFLLSLLARENCTWQNWMIKNKNILCFNFEHFKKTDYELYDFKWMRKVVKILSDFNPKILTFAMCAIQNL